jgi:hypothetical protein
MSRKTKAELQRDLDGAWECLSMVADTLEAIGCSHGHKRSSTPPMMYPEWIICVVSHRVQLARSESVGGRVRAEEG